MVRTGLGKSALGLIFVLGCGGESRTHHSSGLGVGGSGVAETGAAGRVEALAAGATSGPGGVGAAGGAPSSGGTGESSSAAGAAASRGSCACDSTTPECLMVLSSYCVIHAAHCPPTLDDALHDMPALQSLWGGTYSACSDGTRRFQMSYTFEGGFSMVFAPDGSLLAATASGQSDSALVCGPSSVAVGDVSCRTCQTMREGGLEAEGTGGGAGASGAAGEAGIGAQTGDPNGLPYCLVDASGALVMPPE